MILVLSAVALFVVIGLSSERFTSRQGALIALVCVSLIAVQFVRPRFL